MIRNRSSQFLRCLVFGAMILGLAACNSESTSLSSDGSSSIVGTGTGMAALEWVAPTARVNGDPISMSELRGYRVYAGTSQSNMTKVAEINDPYETTLEVNGLDDGTYYFYVTALDTSGLESPPSATKSKTIQT
jgi:fibronectin type 3 domain-containing protein